MGRLLIGALLAGALGLVALALVAGGEEPGQTRIESPDIGLAVEWRVPVGAAVTLEPAREDATYLRTFLEHFESLTPENEMKWERVQPRRGEFSFAEADALVDLAVRHERRVRGHPLVWDQQLPAWVAEGDWDADELEAVLRDHVRTVVGRYRGRVAVWDVVNEPFEDDGSWTPSVWYRVLGERYVTIAFEAAREADPDATLVLNEIAAEHEGPKARALLELARRLARRGVPIDAVGLQNHTAAGDHPRRRRLGELMAHYREAGLDVEITEMDVEIGPGDDLDDQAAGYAAAAEACAAAENCRGLTVWGVTDRYSWIGAERRPLPFDSEGRPKPAFEALRSALAR
jgi:endo-1,4-beta-xylanase